jgi:hypothetical protein
MTIERSEPAHRRRTHHAGGLAEVPPGHPRLEVRGSDRRTAEDRFRGAVHAVLMGLVRHMAEVERGWFRKVMADERGGPDLLHRRGPGRRVPSHRGGHLGGGVRHLAGRDRGGERRTRPGSPWTTSPVGKHRRTGERFNLRWIYTHMIEEYARHNGHADLLRERIDGAPATDATSPGAGPYAVRKGPEITRVGHHPPVRCPKRGRNQQSCAGASNDDHRNAPGHRGCLGPLRLCDRPAAARPRAPAAPPSQASVPRPDGSAEPQVVQAPAREALELINPSHRPKPATHPPHHAPAPPPRRRRHRSPARTRIPSTVPTRTRSRTTPGSRARTSPTWSSRYPRTRRTSAPWARSTAAGSRTAPSRSSAGRRTAVEATGPRRPPPRQDPRAAVSAAPRSLPPSPSRNSSRPIAARTPLP